MDPFLKELQEHLFESQSEDWKEWRALHSEAFTKTPLFEKALQDLQAYFLKLSENFKKAELEELSIAMTEISQALEEKKAEFLKSTPQTLESFLMVLEQEFASWKDSEVREKMLGNSGAELKIRSWNPHIFFANLPANPQASEKDLAASLFLKLQVSGSHFLIPMQSVIEISHQRKIIQLPEPSPATLGLITLRGEMVPILSVENLRMGERLPNPYKFLIIGSFRDQMFGLPASQTDNVIRIDEKTIQSSAHWLGTPSFKSILIDQTIFQIIDPEKLIA